MLFNGCESKADEVLTAKGEKVEKANGEVVSDTGELYRNWEKRIGWIDTPRTKVVYGFVGDAGTLSLKNLKVKSETDFATIALSSLTEEPLSNSDNILLTAVGRSENTDMKFNEEHNEMLNIGRPPILVEAIKAKIEITTKVENLRVWAVNAEGFFTGVIPSEYSEGVFSFKIGECFRTMYYLIQAE
jgi:hypothetical protein